MDDDPRRDIRALNREDLIDYCGEIGEKTYRATQLWQWLWQKGVHQFQEMSNIPIELRERLEKDFVIRAVQMDRQQVSADGTVKCLFRLYDENFVEGVLIPAEDRLTACISSQVGCSLSCKFCATGYMERKRNLNADEIFDQVVLLNRLAEKHYQQPLSNIVFMGMGEPLLNFKNVVEGINRITSKDGLNISPRRITVSTAGIAKMIRRLADEGAHFPLALSLHAADDKKRSQIMPINEQNALPELMDALQYYYRKTQNPVTFEYILFNNFNDGPEDARRLAKLAKGKFPVKVNIIQYNPIREAQFERATEDSLNRFIRTLMNAGIYASVRRSRGQDIDAACGQLANRPASTLPS